MKFTAPFIAALAALGGVADAQRAVCDRNNYATVARQILNPVYFCKFYLAQTRTASPLKQFGPRQMTNLCRCFVQNAPRVRGPFRVLRPKPAPAVCKMTLYRSLTNQYKDPSTFCRFYLRDVRFLSPLPTITSPAIVKKACRCFLERRFAAQTTTTRRTTTRRTTTRRTTTPSRTPTTTPETTPETTPTAEPTTTDSPIEPTTSSDILPTTDLPTLLPTTDLPTLLPTTTTTTSDSAAAESTSSTITQSAELSSTTSSSRAASSSSSSSSSAGA